MLSTETSLNFIGSLHELWSDQKTPPSVSWHRCYSMHSVRYQMKVYRFAILKTQDPSLLVFALFVALRKHGLLRGRSHCTLWTDKMSFSWQSMDLWGDTLMENIQRTSSTLSIRLSFLKMHSNILSSKEQLSLLNVLCETIGKQIGGFSFKSMHCVFLPFFLFIFVKFIHFGWMFLDGFCFLIHFECFSFLFAFDGNIDCEWLQNLTQTKQKTVIC